MRGVVKPGRGGGVGVQTHRFRCRLRLPTQGSDMPDHPPMPPPSAQRPPRPRRRGACSPGRRRAPGAGPGRGGGGSGMRRPQAPWRQRRRLARRRPAGQHAAHRQEHAGPSPARTRGTGSDAVGGTGANSRQQRGPGRRPAHRAALAAVATGIGRSQERPHRAPGHARAAARRAAEAAVAAALSPVRRGRRPQCPARVACGARSLAGSLSAWRTPYVCAATSRPPACRPPPGPWAGPASLLRCGRREAAPRWISATSRSSPTSTMARPRWSTSCSASPAPSATTSGRRARDGLERPRARARHHHPRQVHLGRMEGHDASTSSTRPATPISAARWSASCRWSMA